MSQFGIPDKIFFTTCNWDAAAMRLESYKHFTVDNFKSNTLQILSKIKQHLGEHASKVEIGIQTCVLDWTIHEFIEDFNYAYRNLSLSEHLSLYDYDFDVWASADFQMTLNNQFYIFHKKHDIHPSEPYPVVAAEKLFGYQYSKYYYSRGERNGNIVQSSIQSPLKHVRFIQVEGSSEVFYAHTLPDGMFCYLAVCMPVLFLCLLACLVCLLTCLLLFVCLLTCLMFYCV